MFDHRCRRLVVACLAVMAACDKGEEARTVPDSPASSPVVSPSATPGVISDPITELGIGPLRAGMTVAEARAALGTFEVPAGALKTGCDYAKSPRLPAGVMVMVEDGIVGRVSIDTNSVPTADGARVGDAEARVLQIYGKRASVGPHKYTDGHYVTVKPASGDTTNLIIFETNNGRVTSYRAGRLPQVQYVEGCS